MKCAKRLVFIVTIYIDLIMFDYYLFALVKADSTFFSFRFVCFHWIRKSLLSSSDVLYLLTFDYLATSTATRWHKAKCQETSSTNRHFFVTQHNIVFNSHDRLAYDKLFMTKMETLSLITGREYVKQKEVAKKNVRK